MVNKGQLDEAVSLFNTIKQRKQTSNNGDRRQDTVEGVRQGGTD